MAPWEASEGSVQLTSLLPISLDLSLYAHIKSSLTDHSGKPTYLTIGSLKIKLDLCYISPTPSIQRISIFYCIIY